MSRRRQTSKAPESNVRIVRRLEGEAVVYDLLILAPEELPPFKLETYPGAPGRHPQMNLLRPRWDEDGACLHRLSPANTLMCACGSVWMPSGEAPLTLWVVRVSGRLASLVIHAEDGGRWLSWCHAEFAGGPRSPFVDPIEMDWDSLSLSYLGFDDVPPGPGVWRWRGRVRWWLDRDPGSLYQENFLEYDFLDRDGGDGPGQWDRVLGQAPNRRWNRNAAGELALVVRSARREEGGEVPHLEEGR